MFSYQAVKVTGEWSDHLYLYCPAARFVLFKSVKRNFPSNISANTQPHLKHNTISFSGKQNKTKQQQQKKKKKKKKAIDI